MLPSNTGPACSSARPACTAGSSDTLVLSPHPTGGGRHSESHVRTAPFPRAAPRFQRSRCMWQPPACACGQASCGCGPLAHTAAQTENEGRPAPPQLTDPAALPPPLLVMGLAQNMCFANSQAWSTLLLSLRGRGPGSNGLGAQLKSQSNKVIFGAPEAPMTLPVAAAAAAAGGPRPGGTSVHGSPGILPPTPRVRARPSHRGQPWAAGVCAAEEPVTG